MTLILVIPFNHGVALASDGQVTMGLVKTQVKKIKKFNELCAWSAAGDLHFIQLVEKEFDRLTQKDRAIHEIRWELCDIVATTVKKLPPPPSPQPYSGNFVFVEHRENTTYILNLRENGLSVMLEDVPFAIGIGSEFAYTLLQKYQELIPNKLDNNLASVLAYKIISETIETISVGVGPPIDIWQIPPVKNLVKNELVGIEETYLGLKKAEIEMFLQIKK